MAAAVKAGLHPASGLKKPPTPAMSTQPPSNPSATAFPHSPLTRRQFIRQAGRLATGVAFVAGSQGLGSPKGLGAEKKPLKIAAVLSEFSYRNHAHVFVDNFLEPYLT